MKPEMDPAVTNCANCHAPMPKELRFCRNCGFRLGEGSAEYTETVRFQNAPAGAAPGNNAYAYGAGAMAAASAKPLKKRRRRLSGMTWIFLGLLIFFVAAAGFTAIIRPIRQNISAGISQPAQRRSYVGVNSFDTTDGGVTFDKVEPPGSPADKAGLVGGDIITAVDGQPITTDDEMMDLLGRTPISKTLEIVYLRDGEQKKTQLTTVSREEFDRLQREFRNRPVGKGLFGYEEGDSERVAIPNSKMFGVRLGRPYASMPADMAGIKEGDIVIEFDGVPIRTSEELLSRIRRALPYSTIKVVVLRGEERIEIPLKIGKA
jgi:membrane-associated protease RseP (regulator of RpoE activity)